MQRKHPYLFFRVALGSLTLQRKHPYFLFRVALGSLALPRKQVRIHPVRYPQRKQSGCIHRQRGSQDYVHRITSQSQRWLCNVSKACRCVHRPSFLFVKGAEYMIQQIFYFPAAAVLNRESTRSRCRLWSSRMGLGAYRHRSSSSTRPPTSRHEPLKKLRTTKARRGPGGTG